MRGQRKKRVVHISPDRAVGRLRPVGVHALDGHLDRLHGVAVAVQRHLDDGVEGHVDVRNLVGRCLEEVAEDAAQDGLVGDREDIVLALETLKDGGDAVHDVQVRFALRVAVLEFLAVTEGELAGILSC